MGYIKKETIEKIWSCYREIEAGEKLLADMAEQKEKCGGIDPYHQRLRDAFGRGRDLQLGVPNGENGHRLFDVSPILAMAVITHHVANKKAELDTLHGVVRIELSEPSGLAPALDAIEG